MTMINFLVLFGFSVIFGLSRAQQQPPNYRVAYFVQPPFIEEYQDVLGQTKVRGLNIDLIERLAMMLNFTYQLIKPDRTVTQNLIPNNTQGEADKLIALLVSGDADIVVGPVKMTPIRENFVDFTVPYYDRIGSAILMKRDFSRKTEAKHIFDHLLYLYPDYAWGFLVAAYFVTCFVLWIFDTIRKGCTGRFIEDYEDQSMCCRCFYLCLGPVTPPGSTIGIRLVGALWWILALLVMGSLMAYLPIAKNRYLLSISPISSLDDLARQFRVKYAPLEGSAEADYFRQRAQWEERFYDVYQNAINNSSLTTIQRSLLLQSEEPPSGVKYTNMWRYMMETGFPRSQERAVERVLESPSPDQGFAWIGNEIMFIK